MAQGILSPWSKGGRTEAENRSDDTKILIQNFYGARSYKGRIPPAGNIQVIARISGLPGTSWSPRSPRPTGRSLPVRPDATRHHHALNAGYGPISGLPSEAVRL